MRWLALVIWALLPGCHDFDALVRGDKSLPDGAGGELDLARSVDLASPNGLDADLARAEDLAVPLDLSPLVDLSPPADLVPCALPTLPAVRVHVRAGASPGDGSVSAPFPTLGQGIAAAKMAGNGTAVLIASGVYDESVMIDAELHLWGGWTSDFACLSEQATTIRSAFDDVAAVTIQDTTDASLRRLTAAGRFVASGSDLSIGIDVADATVLLDQVRVQSHEPADEETRRAHGMIARRAIVEVRDSTILAGKATLGATAIDACSTQLTLATSTIQHQNLASAPGEAIRLGPACGAGDPALSAERSLILAEGVTATGLDIHAAQQVRLIGVALWVAATTSHGILTKAGFTSDVLIRGSTVVCQGGSAFHLLDSADVLLEDSILVGNPVFLAESMPDLALTLLGTSFLYGNSGPIAQDNNFTFNAAQFQSTYDANYETSPNLAFSDPELSDYHISTTSPVQNLGSCHLALDIDGEPRPQPAGGPCDIGADEVL